MIINLTPHPINVINEDGGIVFPKCEDPPRLTEVSRNLGEVDGIRLVEKYLRPDANLPAPERDTFFIVPLLIAQVSDRDDLLVVNDTVRDDEGRIIGCKSLARV